MPSLFIKKYLDFGFPYLSWQQNVDVVLVYEKKMLMLFFTLRIESHENSFSRKVNKLKNY